MIVFYTQEEWTPDFLMKLEEQKKICNIAQPGNYTEYAIQGNEFPEIPRRPPERDRPHLNRQQRRARATEARRRNQTQN
jgi:hypothetical protein